MKKFSFEEINRIYNYLKKDKITDKQEKIIIAHMLLNSLEEINCYKKGEKSCFYCRLDEADEHEVEIVCEYNNYVRYAFKGYSLSRMESCPFANLEFEVKKLIRELIYKQILIYAC